MNDEHSSSATAPATLNAKGSTATPDPRSLPTYYTPSPTFRIFHPFGRILLKYFFTLFAPNLRVTGRHHVPLRGPIILAPNHVSHADPPLVYHGTQRPFWYMGKQELFEMPSLAPVVRFLQTFPVDQHGADRAALQFSERLLQHRNGLVIFPEGQCSTTGELGPILPGAALVALRTQVPVIPVGIVGTDHIMPYGAILPRPTLAPVRMHFGAPLHFDDLSHLPRREQREAATQRIEQALRKVVDIARKDAGLI